MSKEMYFVGNFEGCIQPNTCLQSTAQGSVKTATPGLNYSGTAKTKQKITDNKRRREKFAFF